MKPNAYIYPGALAANENWIVVLDGNISFDNNVAGNRGGEKRLEV